MADATAPAAIIDTSRKKRHWPPEFNALIGLIGIAIVFEILGWIVRDQSFFGNLTRLKIMILQVSIIGIIAIGVTQVIISGGIDLSSGSVVGWPSAFKIQPSGTAIPLSWATWILP